MSDELDRSVPASLLDANKFFADWRDERTAVTPQPPDVIYHYTNTAPAALE